MEKELGTTYNSVGGNNPIRIGASCGILEHKFQKGVPLTRIMFDLGALITPKNTEFDAIFPDVREYLGTETSYPNSKLDAIFITHGHEDHLGAYVHLARAGYTFPPTYASKETLAVGEKLINKEIEQIPNEKVRRLCKERLELIRNGERDFRF
jgi:mRNA degradation ribonuclease J1/J2